MRLGGCAVEVGLSRMRNLFRLRLETPEGFQNQLFTFLDAGDTQDDTRIAVLAEWHDRSVRAAAEPALRKLTRDYQDLQTPAGAFLEDFVVDLEAACDCLPDAVRNAYDLGIVLCRGRSLYVLHTRGFRPRFSLGGPPAPLQSTMRLRVKDLPIAALGPDSGREPHVRLSRVFFEDEDRVVLWLDGGDRALPGVQVQDVPPAEVASEFEPPRARIVLLKEPVPESDAVEGMTSDWPHSDEQPRRDRATMSYAALALMVLIFATALFGMSRWQRMGGLPENDNVSDLLPEGIDSSLNPAVPSRVSADVAEALPTNDGARAAAPQAHAASDEARDQAVARMASQSASEAVSLQLAWSKHHADWVTSSPQLVQDQVVYGCRDGHLYAVDTAGTPRWDYDSGSGIGATPGVDGTRVYCGNYGGRAFALRALDGYELWARDLGAKIVATPAVGRSRVFFQTYSGDVVALDAKTGRAQWKVRIGGNLRARPVVTSQQVLVVSGAGELLCLDQETGSRLWSVAIGSRVISNPLLVGRHVILGSQDGRLHAVSLEEGALEWRVRLSGPVNSSPSTDDGSTIYVGSSDRNLYAIDAQNGAVRWQYRTQGPILSTPWVEDGRVYFTSYDQHTYVLDARNGGLMTKIGLGAPIYSSPLVHDGRVYFGSNDGTVYCLNEVP